MRGFFTFAGVNSKDFGVYINGSQTFGAPERDVDLQSVPGRNGDLVLDNGRLKNIQHSYEAFIVRDIRANLAGLRDFLTSCVGYHRLEDTYHPDEFYLASYAAELSPDMAATLREGAFTLTFNRKPQRFLKDGELVRAFTAGGRIRNPTRQTAAPLIRVYGTGTLGVGNETVNILSNPGYIDLDCDSEDAHMGAVNCNGLIELPSDDFPRLPPGETGLVLGSGIARVEITPRWWRA